MKKPQPIEVLSKRSPTQKTKAITIRLPLSLVAQLEIDAASQDWSVNAEINHRLRAGPLLDQLRSLTLEVAELRAMLKARQGNDG